MRFFTAILLTMTILLTACDSGSDSTPTPTTAPTPQRYTVALVMKTLTNPFFIEMERGAREAEATFEIDLIVRVAALETSIQQQIEIINALTDEGVDAIVIAPGDSVELIPALRRAQEAGIVIVNIDNRLDAAASASQGLVDVPFISVDNEAGAYLAAQYLSSLVTQPTQVLVLEGIRAAQNAQDRRDGALRAFAENENITVVAQETANWLIDQAYQVTGEQFTLYPEIGLIFASNDVMAFGAIQYLNENGLDAVLVGGFDALPEARQAIRDGDLAVTVDQQAARQGYLGVEYAVRLLRGETVEMETMVETVNVTATNVDPAG